ncbi:S8 family serine peptidase [Nonomuraea sp. NPDC026600]|uniref:S8 family serine peptidase n=1 Tax=Nonomuraea sp. NPDC026600 TaxID=3155363 RepID=UPI00340153D6
MIGRTLAAGMLALQLTSAPAFAAVPVAEHVQAERRAPVECKPRKGTTQLPGTEPWAQRRLDIKNVWRITRGAGVKVAVVDSGVDYQHPQIQISKFIDVTHTGYRDCVGHGTAVAGIIAGRYLAGVPFHGVAPEVQLISVKQSNSEEGEVADLVKGIKEAVDRKADVINVSVRAADHPDLKAVIQYALSRDIVVVAAAGNITKEDGPPEPAYPAAYDGVLAVGSANSDGRRADSSNTATPVGVLGPGVDITAPWTGKSYMRGLEGTSFAAPYVAGVAALVRARFPKLDQQQVRQRITATADGSVGTGTGAGMVNPLLAVTASLSFDPAGAPVVAPPPPSPLPADAVAKAPRPDEHATNVALLVTVGALGVAAVAAAAASLIPLGRRRGWRPGRPAA